MLKIHEKTIEIDKKVFSLLFLILMLFLIFFTVVLIESLPNYYLFGIKMITWKYLIIFSVLLSFALGILFEKLR